MQKYFSTQLSGEPKEYAMINSKKYFDLARKACRTHGLSNTRIYGIYRSMLRRCYNAKCKGYSDYGGRGIKVCDEWRNDIHVFVNWALTHGYEDNLTIERKNNNLGYSPSNCCFITRSEQNKNTTRIKKLTFNGETKIQADWIRQYKLNSSIIWYGMNKRGLSRQEALIHAITRLSNQGH